MTVPCPSCGHNNRDDARTCAVCLARLESPERPLSIAPQPELPPPLDPDQLHRERFVYALFKNTPHTFVTWMVMAINIAVFLLMAIRARSIGAPDVLTSLAWGASYGPAITTHGEWWRMLTGAFVHAGIVHIAANMYVLFVMGPLTERLYGNAAYAVLYLLAALSGSLASVYWHPLVPSVGASGAVFGVMGGILAYTLRERRSLPPSILRSVGSVVTQNVVINLVINLAMPHVDMAAHVGGLIGGFVFGICLAGPVDDRAARKVRRAAVTALAGTVLIAGATRQLPAFDDFLGTLNKYDRVEPMVWSRFEKLDAEPKPDQKTRDAAATAIANDVVSPWTTLRNEIARMRLPAKEHGVATQLVRYMDLQAEAWRLIAQYYRTNDLRLVKASRDKNREATVVKARLDGRAPAVAAKDDGLDAAIAWQAAMQRMSEADQKANAAYNDGVTRLRANRISAEAFAQIIESQVLPAAREAAAAVSVSPPTPAQQDQQRRVADYARLRVEAWELSARAIRENSPALAQQAKEKQAAAAAAVKSAPK
jgi:rhomboid protease GluP